MTVAQPQRLAAFLLLLGVLLPGGGTAAAQQQPPSPEQVLGYPAGAHFTPSAGVQEYARALAAASPRVEYRPYGVTRGAAGASAAGHRHAAESGAAGRDPRRQRGAYPT
jgi:hypothetical protein